jgi:hypothetical protein
MNGVRFYGILRFRVVGIYPSFRIDKTPNKIVQRNNSVFSRHGPPPDANLSPCPHSGLLPEASAVTVGSCCLGCWERSSSFSSAIVTVCGRGSKTHLSARTRNLPARQRERPPSVLRVFTRESRTISISTVIMNDDIYSDAKQLQI